MVVLFTKGKKIQIGRNWEKLDELYIQDLHFFFNYEFSLSYKQ